MTGPAGGYQLRAGTAMPPLLLDDDEAIAIAVGLRTAAGASVTGIEETAVRALVKLEQVLPSHLRRRVQALQARDPDAAGLRRRRGRPAVPDGRSPPPCRDHERVRFAYTARDQAGTPPRGRAALARQRRPPLVPRRVGLRPRRLAHVPRRPHRRSPRRPARASTRATLPAKDAAAFVAQRLRVLPVALRGARDASHAPAAELQGRRWLGGDVTPIDDDRCELRTSDDNLDWLAMRIAMLGVDYEVHGPPELIERLRGIAAGIAHAT